MSARHPEIARVLELRRAKGWDDERGIPIRRRVTAKVRERCSVCGGWIEEGETHQFNGGSRAHLACCRAPARVGPLEAAPEEPQLSIEGIR